MTMNKPLHPRDDVASIEDSIDSSIQGPEYYIQKHEGGLITATRNETDNTRTNRMTIIRETEMGRKTTTWAF